MADRQLRQEIADMEASLRQRPSAVYEEPEEEFLTWDELEEIADEEEAHEVLVENFHSGIQRLERKHKRAFTDKEREELWDALPDIVPTDVIAEVETAFTDLHDGEDPFDHSPQGRRAYAAAKLEQENANRDAEIEADREENGDHRKAMLEKYPSSSEHIEAILANREPTVEMTGEVAELAGSGEDIHTVRPSDG